jgi:hypothetical protein
MSSMHFAITSVITATIADAISFVQPLRKLVLSGAEGRLRSIVEHQDELGRRVRVHSLCHETHKSI